MPLLLIPKTEACTKPVSLQLLLDLKTEHQHQHVRSKGLPMELMSSHTMCAAGSQGLAPISAPPWP